MISLPARISKRRFRIQVVCFFHLFVVVSVNIVALLSYSFRLHNYYPASMRKGVKQLLAVVCGHENRQIATSRHLGDS